MDGLLLQLPNLDPTTRWLMIIAAVLTILYAVMRPSRRKKDPLDRSNPSPTLASQRQVERDMNNLLVELSEMARQITAQLDTRATRLQLLIAEADQRLERLSACGGSTSTPERPPSNRHADVPAPPPVDPRHIEVYVLADQGRTAGEIAARLSRPSGEVELILALRERAANV
jgi:hypothetical protein